MSRDMSKIRRWNLVILAAVVALITAACGSSNPLGGGEVSGDLKSVVVGSPTSRSRRSSPKSMRRHWRPTDSPWAASSASGAAKTYIPRGQDSWIDLIPEYTGNLLQYFDKNTRVTTPNDVLLALFRTLPGDLSILNPSPAEARTPWRSAKRRQKKWNLESIADLAAHSPEVKFGAPSEFLNRTEGLPGLKAKYGPAWTCRRTISWRSVTAADPQPCAPLVDGTVTARLDIFSTSPAIKENNLVVLEDPKNNFLAAKCGTHLSARRRNLTR